MSLQGERVRLFLSSEHLCGYLPGRAARNLFIDPEYRLDPARYDFLLQQGFRRGGDHVYRPRCEGCQACVPVRLPVARFRPDRSQRRCLARNRDLRVDRSAQLDERHFALYQRYLRSRHADGGMNPDDAGGFRHFLDCAWGVAEFWDFLDPAGELLACAVVDRTPRALSAVYTFFEPEQPSRGLGTYAVLRQIEQARREGLEYLYLGYWVGASRKMAYKQRFQPLERLGPLGWV
ncbi:MAG TPA: arginyltransferase [Nevskiaceae bacterium]|nr:arginyltransferase [Nevskiaceae bacterium]